MEYEQYEPVTVLSVGSAEEEDYIRGVLGKNILDLAHGVDGARKNSNQRLVTEYLPEYFKKDARKHGSIRELAQLVRSENLDVE